MRNIVDDEIASVQLVPPGNSPNYNKDNPVWRLVRAVEETQLAAERECYLADCLQYLFPIATVALYGPSGEQSETRDPRQQDNKNDFQKQNVCDLKLTDTRICRGYVHSGDWTGCFIHLTFEPGAASPLAGRDGLYRSSSVKLYLKVGAAGTADGLLTVPYDAASGRYEIEIWSCTDAELQALTGAKAREAIARGALIAKPDLVQGSLSDFQGPDFDRLRDETTAEGRGLELLDHAPDHAMQRYG